MSDRCPICDSPNIEENDPEPGIYTCRDCGEEFSDDDYRMA